MDKLIKIFIILITFISFASPAFSKIHEQESDFLYSQEYFDYLIECASIEKNKQETIKAKEESFEEVDFDEFSKNEEIITNEFVPFKLHIQENSRVNPYNETFKKEDSKTIIMLTDKFSVIQDMVTIKNKYNSNDYRVLAGVEYSPFKFFKLSSGLETNFRGQDQNPNSRKIYFTPIIQLNEKISLSFYNKFNVLTKSQDHDIGLNISPFKSKFMDFGIYAGTTHYHTGTHSKSINFRTNLYFF